jgi:hypothetical protein
VPSELHAFRKLYNDVVERVGSVTRSIMKVRVRVGWADIMEDKSCR